MAKDIVISPSPTGFPYISFSGNSASKMKMVVLDNGDLVFSGNTSNITLDGGKLGIGTATPNEALTVVGDISGTTDLHIAGNIYSGTTNISTLFGSGGGSSTNYITAGDGGTGSIEMSGASATSNGNFNVVLSYQSSGYTGNYVGVIGGKGHDVTGDYAATLGGYENTVSNAKAAIVGGGDNVASGVASSIIGGYRNTASGEYTSIIGGYVNSATGSHSVVVGGQYNEALSGSSITIIGGNDHKATGAYSTIIGGYQNTISSGKSIISGGEDNQVTGEFGAILGGYRNTVSGLYGGIVNGYGNSSSGDYSSVIGGKYNIVSGNNSVIIGGSNITGTTNNSVYVPGLFVSGQMKYTYGTPGSGKILTSDSAGNVSWGNDVFLTGGTYSAGNITQTNSTGGTFNINVTSLTADTHVFVTGGTYSAGNITQTNSTGGTFNINVSALLDDTNNYLTGATMNGNSLELERHNLSDVTVDLSQFNTSTYWSATTGGDIVISGQSANVGIGTSPNTGATLHVSGNTRMDGQTYNPLYTLTDGATITPDFDNGNIQTVELGGNRTIANPSNIVAGSMYTLILKQDSTGSRTVAWGDQYMFPGGTTPTLTTTANKVDIINLMAYSTTVLMVTTVYNNFSAEASSEDYVTNDLIFNIDCLNTDSYPGSGSIWTSTVNSSNIGTLNGDTLLTGGHMYFDGTNDFVEFVTTSDSITSDPFTIEVWFNATTSSHDVVFANSTAGGGGFYCKTQGSNIYLYGTSSGSSYRVGYVSTGTWYQMVITIDGTTVNFWKNGVNLGSAGNNGSPGYIISSTNPFFIGNDSSGGGDFQGYIDIVRTYDRVLTTAEIEQNFDAEKVRFGLG